MVTAFGDRVSVTEKLCSRSPQSKFDLTKIWHKEGRFLINFSTLKNWLVLPNCTSLDAVGSHAANQFIPKNNQWFSHIVSTWVMNSPRRLYVYKITPNAWKKLSFSNILTAASSTKICLKPKNIILIILLNWVHVGSSRHELRENRKKVNKKPKRRKIVIFINNLCIF